MSNSILESIKKLLGLPKDYDAFDQDVIMHINSAFSILKQLGVGSSGGFVINSYDETWSDYILNESCLNDVKTYIYLKVRLWFDPPTNSSVLNAMQSQINELEWRLNSEVDYK